MHLIQDLTDSLHHVLNVCMGVVLVAVNALYALVNLTYLWAEPRKGLTVMVIILGASAMLFVVTSLLSRKVIYHTVAGRLERFRASATKVARQEQAPQT